MASCWRACCTMRPKVCGHHCGLVFSFFLCFVLFLMKDLNAATYSDLLQSSSLSWRKSCLIYHQHHEVENLQKPPQLLFSLLVDLRIFLLPINQLNPYHRLWSEAKAYKAPWWLPSMLTEGTGTKLKGQCANYVISVPIMFKFGFNYN